MTATINYLPEIPAPESVKGFRGLQNCWVIELPNLIIWSVDRDKCICKAKAILGVLHKIKKCD